MSGHNRWSKIKHQKAAMGATKGAAFSRIAKELMVAARMGGSDPVNNYRLRAAMDAARDVNMPGDTITRAIKKGTGELEGVNYEELRYEGYAPGGVAVIVACVTDNKFRTASDMRSTFTKYGGNLGSDGSVAFLFEHKGTIHVKPGPGEDAVMEAALEAGASDVVSLGEEGFEVRTGFAELFQVAERLSHVPGLALGESKAAYLPLNTVAIDGEVAPKVIKLLDALGEFDDVQNLWSNADLPDTDA